MKPMYYPPKAIASCLFIALIGLFSNSTVYAQIFVADRSGNVTDYNFDGTAGSFSVNVGYYSGASALVSDGTNLFAAVGSNIQEYSISTGTLEGTYNPSSGNLGGLAIVGNELYASDFNHGYIDQYTISGSTLTAGNTLVNLRSYNSGAYPLGIIAQGTNLYVVDNSQIDKVTTSGAVSLSLVSGLASNQWFAGSGTNLFTPNSSGGVDLYDTSGNFVKSGLISGFYPNSVAADGSKLYVGHSGNVSQYTLSGSGSSTTATFSSNLISGSSGLSAITVSDTQATPEPSTWAMLLGGLAALLFVHQRRRRV